MRRVHRPLDGALVNPRVGDNPKTGKFAIADELVTEAKPTEEAQLSVGGVHRRLAERKFEVEDRPLILSICVKTEDGEVVLKGPSFNCTIAPRNWTSCAIS